MKKDYLTRRESIIFTAIEIISDLGLPELSVREIAKREGITDASLYRHFKSKREIVLAVLDYFSRFDENIINTIKSSKVSNVDGIHFFFKTLAEYYENYPELTAIEHSYEILLHDQETADKVKSILIFRTQFISQLIDEAVKSNEIKSDTDSEYLTYSLFGTVIAAILKWRALKKSFPLKDTIVNSLEALLNAYKI